MKKKMNLLLSMLVTLALMVSMMPAAMAATTVDPEVDKGSITVTLKYKEEPVKDIEITIYRVAEGRVANNNLYYDLLDALKPAEDSTEEAVELDGLNAEAVEKATTDLMKKINAMEKEERDALKAGAVKTDENGVAKFENLPVGVYIAVKTSSSRYNFNPFMLYLPYTETETNEETNEATSEWVFDVTAEPKVTYRSGGGGGGGGEEPPIVIPDPEVPLDPGETPEEPPIEIPDEEPPLAELPQTGLLQWPILVMGSAGLLLIALGLLSEQKRKARN